MEFNISNKGIKEYTKRLERIHKSALPVVVRQTLNSAAFDVKSRTMPAIAKKTFIQRKPNFFKATSKVKPAVGFSIHNMKSEVGFEANHGKSIDKAVKDLATQEDGGKITNRSHIATDKARVSNQRNKMVKANARMGALGSQNYFDTKQSTGKTAKQRFIRTAIMAQKIKGKQGLVLGNPDKNRIRVLSRVDSVKHSTNRRRIKIKITPLYSVKAGRAVKIKATHFMKRSAFETEKIINREFEKHARKQFEKHQS